MNITGWITSLYHYCLNRPITALGIIIVLFMIGGIVSVAFKESRHTGFISLFIMLIVFIAICSMIPCIIKAGGTILKNDAEKTVKQMESDSKNDIKNKKNKTRNTILDELRNIGVPVDEYY